MWRKYFKTPFKDGAGIYIFDADGHPIADYIIDLKKKDEENLIKCLNGEYVSDREHKFTLDTEDTQILMDSLPIIRMRGWGYLTGTGGHHLDAETAIQVQDSMARFICEQLNKKSNE